ncbi:MAG: dihydrofolate reductase family protein [Candidatus Promineifilaceae bacterium]|nr:dihydrofolate reductase family protein [Candidatus Promineifilaceae bacterium]
MSEMVQQLFPQPVQEFPLEGLYLAHDLRQHSMATGNPFVYTNFISSIDGRIAIPHPTRSGLMVPKSIANDRDWRLFQELAAQADIIISSGRYLRDWVDGRAQEILEVDDPRYADLRQWREERGLPLHPDIAIISGSLNFPVPDVLTAQGRHVVIFTTAKADPERVEALKSNSCKIIVAGEERVEGDILVRRMNELGYHTIYSATGPKVNHLLLAGGALNRLYLTMASRILGGNPYSTVVEGSLFENGLDMRLSTLYIDSAALDGLGQMFMVYDRV